jgi:antitoxin ChpS
MLYICITRNFNMYITNLRKVGGSVMLAVPPALLDLLHLKAGAAVGVAVDGDRLVVEATRRPRYTLEELLAASDYAQPRSLEEQEWVNGPAVGKEIL